MKFTSSKTALLAVLATASSQLTSAADDGHYATQYHLIAREIVTLEVTSQDGSKVSIDAPYMQIELESHTYYENKPLSGVSAQIVSSGVAETPMDDLACFILDNQMNPVGGPIKHDKPTPLGQNNAAVPVFAVGCGNEKGGLNGAKVMERETRW